MISQCQFFSDHENPCTFEIITLSPRSMNFPQLSMMTPDDPSVREDNVLFFVHEPTR